jgi:phosphoglycerate kinase
MLSSKLALKDILPTIKDKRVLMRVDFNVPLKEGKVKDKTRIEATIPSINAIFEAGAKALILMSHLGRPDGNRVEKDSLKPVVSVLEELAKRKVIWLDDCVGKTVEEACANPAPGSLILLENLRFHVEEEGTGIIKKEESGVVKEEKIKAKKEDVDAFRASLTK